MRGMLSIPILLFLGTAAASSQFGTGRMRRNQENLENLGRMRTNLENVENLGRMRRNLEQRNNPLTAAQDELAMAQLFPFSFGIKSRLQKGREATTPISRSLPVKQCSDIWALSRSKPTKWEKWVWTDFSCVLHTVKLILKNIYQKNKLGQSLR